MKELMNNAYYWQKVDSLIFSLDYTKIRDQGDCHPMYANLVYPLEYGYMVDSDKDQAIVIKVFRGSLEHSRCDAIVFCADILVKDMDTKLLIGCTDEEKMACLDFLNQTPFQKTILVSRSDDIPAWAAENEL